MTIRTFCSSLSLSPHACFGDFFPALVFSRILIASPLFLCYLSLYWRSLMNMPVPSPGPASPCYLCPFGPLYPRLRPAPVILCFSCVYALSHPRSSLAASWPVSRPLVPLGLSFGPPRLPRPRRQFFPGSLPLSLPRLRRWSLTLRPSKLQFFCLASSAAPFLSLGSCSRNIEPSSPAHLV